MKADYFVLKKKKDFVVVKEDEESSTRLSMIPQITEKSSVLLALPPYFFSVLVPLHTECHY